MGWRLGQQLQSHLWVGHNVEYIMTPEKLERVDRLDPKELRKGNYKLKEEETNDESRIDNRPERKTPDTNKGYRYRQDNQGDDQNDDKKDSAANKTTSAAHHETIAGEERESIAIKTKKQDPSTGGSLSVFGRLF